MSGEAHEGILNLYFLCHGYGQLAMYFIKKFEALDDPDTLLIAPEGLHRFYLEGGHGKIGASWMTSEDRQNDIKDYVNYLDALYNEFHGKCRNHRLKVHLLGFSQGTATASRWLCRGKVKADSLILWAGALAHDLDPTIDKNMFNNVKVFLLSGNDDPYFKLEHVKSNLDFTRQFKKDVTSIEYKGGHKIEKEVLMLLKNKLNE